MYELLPSFVLGFHGCDESVAEEVFAGRTALRASVNEYDWLGHGVYFWENNPQRALDYARELQQRPERSKGKVGTPTFVGAVIDLGRCLNLLDAQHLALVKDGYQSLFEFSSQAGVPMPQNRPARGSTELLLRNLDCAVIETVHQLREKDSLPDFESVRGVFVEGAPLYPGAGFHERNHIQFCIRNRSCIKGYFRLLSDQYDNSRAPSAE